MKRTREDIVLALKHQLAALKSSGAAYDTGTKWEAMRLATAVYTLVHDGGRRNRSILTQLGVRDQLKFFSTGSPSPGNLAVDMPLVALRMMMRRDGTTSEYVPHLGDSPPLNGQGYVQFNHWWDDPIFRDQNGRTLSRKNVVASLRDQEGGSHFDEALTDPAYIGVAKEGSAKWHLLTNAGEQLVEPGQHLAMMRQIAWEIEHTLSQQLAEELA